MDLVHLPLLEVHRELYSMPRGMERFRAYLARMTGGGEDIALPLASMNPMGKEHLLRLVEQLLALGAEDEARRALADARAAGPGRLRVGLVVADDVAGGWTNRTTTDFAHRFESAPWYQRDFGLALLWASEPPSLERVRQEVLRTVARCAYERIHGPARTLRQMLAQENAALPLSPALSPYLDARDAPTLIACLYGDDAARALGYTPLGIAQKPI